MDKLLEKFKHTEGRVHAPVSAAVQALAKKTGVTAQCIADAELVLGSLEVTLLGTAQPINQWISRYPNNNSAITQINLPGTHDSCAVSWLPFVSTQTLGIVQQLDSGIRFLDLRVGFHKNGNTEELYMFHGDILINSLGGGIRLQDVLTGVYAWLSVNNREFVMVSVRRDGPDSTTGQSAASAIAGIVKQNPNLWNKNDWSSGPPKISEVQGQIVLVRRFAWPSTVSNAIGVDFNMNWADNNPSFTIPYNWSNVNVGIGCVQDQYQPDGSLNKCIQQKYKAISDHFTRARTGPDQNLYLNFASGTNAPFVPPPFLSGGVNPQIVAELSKPLPNNSASRVGIVLVDFCEAPSNLIQAIVDSNSRPSGDETGPPTH
jgi:1-phosphatidylinositol phosphodiesterase